MPEPVYTQFKLTDEGLILFQPDASNPLPGQPVAHLRKGASALEPAIEMQAVAPAKDAAEQWLKTHIQKTLEPLIAVRNEGEIAEPVKAICAQVYDAMGIVPREQVEDSIAKLLPETRQQLRARQVRLGPVLVFIPALNKPASVRLRGVLRALWEGRPLPPPLPYDGAVSVKVDESADRDFYRAIGYPVYGPRAVRIDMLDRVISAVYESAKEGKFQAKHEMAEWLGCGIEDLYAILEAMGHRKTYDPAAEQKPEGETEAVPESVPAVAAEGEQKPAAQAKPELATFILRRGRATGAGPKKEKNFKKSEDNKPRVRKKDRPAKKKDDNVRIMQAAAPKKAEDSPFAILQQLKVKKDAS